MAQLEASLTGPEDTTSASASVTPHRPVGTSTFVPKQQTDRIVLQDGACCTSPPATVPGPVPAVGELPTGHRSIYTRAG